MREAPLTFFTEKDKKQYQYIDLIAFEASYVYMANTIDNGLLNFASVNTTVTDILVASGYDFSDQGDGHCWTISVESGPNVGAVKKVTNFFPIWTSFFLETDLEYPLETGDTIRIAKMLFLTSRNTPVDFYLPDDTSAVDEAMEYQPFPLKIIPIGTNSKSEIMSLDVTLASANRIISDAIQVAEGLQGNKVIHLRTFDNVLDQGKEYCMKDVSYVDSVNITKTEIKFELETKFNIVGVAIPRRTFTKDFCGFMLGDEACIWRIDDQGYGGRDDDEGNPLYTYPDVSATTCDHTLNGPNGCKAHNNSKRFGGFPTIVNT